MLLVSLAAMFALAAADTPESSAGPPQEGAAAAVQTGQAGKPGKPAKDPSKKIVCVEQPQTGSIIVKRICATRAEWDERARLDKEEWERQNRAGGN